MTDPPVHDCPQRQLRLFSDREEVNKTPQGRAGRALGWSFAGQLTTQVVSFLAAIALARLLSPTDFGLVGMVAVFVGFLGILTDTGVTAALIQRQARPGSTSVRYSG